MKFLFFLFCLLVPTVVSAQVVISEVHWAGYDGSTADEWFEIVNISSEEIFLEGWSVTRRTSDGSDTPMITFENDATISPGEFQIISNYSSEKSLLNVSSNYITTSVSLSNTKLFLQVLNAEGEVVDTVDDGTGAPFAGGKDPFSSMERLDFSASGSEKTNWKTAEVSVGFDVNDVYGTPGRECEECKEGKESEEIYSSQSSHSSLSLQSNIRITEVLTNPTGSNDYSWIELGNLGDDPVDIFGWEISDGSRSYIVEPRSENNFLLEPNEHAIFFHYQTHISLSDSDVIILSYEGKEVDRLPLSTAGEEVSFGRTEDGSRGRFCIPTPREKNSDHSLQPQIIVQSGRSTDYTKVTLNLKAEVQEGSLKNAKCHWDFNDGTSSEKCNPPSHSWDYPDVYTVRLQVLTPCGREVEATKEVVVLTKKNPKTSLSSSTEKLSSLNESISSTRSISIQKSSALSVVSLSNHEQKMYSTKTSTRSSEKLIGALPVKYKNIVVQNSSLARQIGQSTSSTSWQYIAKKYDSLPQGQSEESEVAWLLLFSQSALWLLLAGKKMI